MDGDIDPRTTSVSDAPKFSDLYATRFVWAIWAILFLSVLTYINAFGYNIPFLDEYELVDALTGHQQVNLAWLWEQHNEHRIFLPRLLHLGLAWLTKTDFRAGMYFNGVALAGLAAAMIFAARRLRGRTSYVDAFFPVALLNYGHCENLLWGFQIEFLLSTLLACAILLLVVLRSHESPTWRWVLLAGLCLVGLPLTGAHGLPFVPPLAAWLVIWAWQHRNSPETHGRSALTISLLLAGVSLFLLGWYFVGYKSCELHPPSSRLMITIKLMRQFLAIGCGAGVISWWSIARFMGLVLLFGSFLVLAWRAWRLPQERVRCLGFMAFLVGMAGLAFCIGWGRGGIGIHLGFSFRYATLSVPWICCLFFMAQLSRSKWLTRGVQTALVLMMAMLLKENTRYGIIYAHGQKQHFEAVVADLKANRSAQQIATKHPFLYPLPDLLASRLEKLKDAGIGPWGLMGSTRGAANTGTEKR